MLIALAVAAALVTYTFIGGAVHRVLVTHRFRLTRYAEGLFAAIWPAIPLALVVSLGISAVDRGIMAVARLGGRAADLPGRLLSWRRRRRDPLLHTDCAAGLGPCDWCRRRMERAAEKSLPPARIVQQ